MKRRNERAHKIERAPLHVRAEQLTVNIARSGRERDRGLESKLQKEDFDDLKMRNNQTLTADVIINAVRNDRT